MPLNLLRTLLVAVSAAAALPHAVNQQASAPAAELRARIDASPLLPFRPEPVIPHTSAGPLPLGAISGVAVFGANLLYIIQRGQASDPILALDASGNLIRSWGNGDFTLPHSIRVDAAGNVWTVDAGSSQIIEYKADGTRLQTIVVGEQPDNGSAFRGATDLAFTPNGHLFITDGYANARVLEYSLTGQRLAQWGRPGSAPGDFHLPHSIQVAGGGTLFVADRENGRIETFDQHGRFLGQIDHLGRTYALKLDRGALWASMGPFDQPPGAPGWILKLNPRTGRILGHLNVTAPQSGHALDLTPSGEPIVTAAGELLWFRRN